MKIKPLHPWDLSPKDAIALQKQLALRVKIEKPAEPLRFIAGVDCALTRDGQSCIAGVVIWDRQAQQIIATYTALAPLVFPYIPGLLSFREAPAILNALRQVEQPVDGIMLDGQGIAHPRRLGIACHIGLFTDMPALGCGKSRLTGHYLEPAIERGAKQPLRDKQEIIGTILRTRDKVKPVFVSAGHKMDLATAEQLVLDCALGYRLPEPTRQADKLVALYKKN